MAGQTKKKEKDKLGKKPQPVDDYCFPTKASYVILFETTKKKQPRAWTEVSTTSCLASRWKVREFFSDLKSYEKRLAEYGIVPQKPPKV